MAQLLQDFISVNAANAPENLLIQDGSLSITYGEMDRFANQFAHYLVAKGVAQQDRVALFIPKSIALFKALVSVLKADAVYVPLNIQAPSKRNAYIIEQARCSFLMCDKTTKAEAFFLAESVEASVTVIVIDEVVLNDTALTPLTYRNRPSDLAYVLYTSGSTGQPKGAMISHGNVINYAEWVVDYFQVTPRDRMSNHPGIFFDLSVFDIFPAFKSGASLHLVPQESSMFPIKIIEFIETYKLTIWNTVPSLYTFMVRAGVLDPKRLSHLRALTFNGEVMPTATVMAWMNACPRARFFNQYGPTETTCASLFYEITEIPRDPLIPLPIGRPIAGTSVFALTEEGRKAEVNESGELYITGAGVGRGYLFDEEKTKKAFIDNPLAPGTGITYRTGDLVKVRPDGNVDFLGRKDHQIKFMGYRIELGEIESALNAQEYISTSAAIAVDHANSDGIAIVAFMVLSKAVEHNKIKADVGKIIPHYMVPKIIIEMPKLPMNSNGKIDRNKLKELYTAGAK